MYRWKSLIAVIVISLGINLLTSNVCIGGLGVSVNPSTWAIGNVTAGQIKNAGANYFTVSNTGTQFERLAIKVSSSAPGGMKPGTSPGKDIFVLKYGDSTTGWTILTETESTLAQWIIDGDYTKFDLQFQSPRDTSRPLTEQQTVTVTISAYADNPTALENRTLPARAPWYGSVIVYIPQFTVNETNPTGSWTAGGFWVDKYESSQPNVSTAAGSRDTNPSLWPVAKNTDPGTVPAVSIANKPPWDYISYQQAIKACRNRGSGFHLITGYEWASIAEYAKQVYSRQIPGNNTGTVPPGDQDVDTSGTQAGTGDTTMTGTDATNYNNKKDLTGSGPTVWSIDGNGNGPYDINGNVWEWCQGLFLKQTTGYAYIYDVTKSCNYGSCTKGTGDTVILGSADDGTDLTALSDNYWGTSGYYLLDSANAFHQISGYTASTKILSLGSTPTSGTYAYGIYKATTTNITTGMTSANRILTIRNSDSDLKYYAVPATSDATGSADYGTDAYWFDTSADRPLQRSSSWMDYNSSGGFAFYLIDNPTYTYVTIGVRACK